MEKNSKILVTGANGMVGRNLVLKLRELGFNNILTPTSKDIDLKKRDLVFDLFKKESFDYVFHLAAKVGGIRANIENPVEFLRDNLLINTNVIDACYKFKIKKLVNLGSSCIYPKECLQPMKEEYLLSDKLEPTNEGYALSKISSLKLCKYYNEQYKTNFISLMPPNMYGRYEKFDLNHSHVLSALIMRFHDSKTKNEESISVWGTGEARREFLNVKDMANALIFGMEKIEVFDLFDNCFLNCGSMEEISIRNLAYKIKEIVGFNGRIEFDETKPEGMKRKMLDCNRIFNLGFKPKISLNEGIKELYSYYLKINS